MTTKPPPPLPTKKFRTVLEPRMIHTACEAITLGLPLAAVAGLLGVSRNTFHRWLTEGSDEACQNPLWVELAVSVAKARSEASLNGVKIMNLHAADDWKAQLELLRAQDPETWAARSQSKVEVAVTPKEATRDLSLLSDEELEQLERIEAKMAAAKALPA